MYESFYNLKVEPFRLSPDHRFCFSHKSYAKAKAYMQYAIHRAEGFVMVTGKPGTGKTTLVNDLVDGLSQSRIVVATIVSTQLEADDLLRLVACNFGLDIDAPNKAVVLQGLSVRLRRYHEEGTRALLIIDEAQDLSASALEELRLLTNLQLNNQPLLQIFLVGQENLRELVQKPSMEQVHQRLVAACHLEALSEQDTKAYIRHRLDRVGWKNDPTIDEGVYPVVFQFSKGVPRRINLICSRFLLHGCVEEKHRIRASDVRTVVGELQHEQLAPIGFKADLPPLLDDEEFESDLETAAEADDNETSRSTKEPSVPDAGVAEQPPTNDNPAATPLISPAPVNPGGNQIADLCSLEEQVRREESHSSYQSDNSQQDVIQENYFSLSEAVDLPSEPIPIHKPAETPLVEHVYGNRFANAQRRDETGGARTHYYNEYQVSANPHGIVTRKWSMLSTALIFLLIAAAVLIALYVISPRLLQDGIVDLERQIDSNISSLSKDPTTSKPDPLPVKDELNKNEQDSGVADLENQSQAVQNTNISPDTDLQSNDSSPFREEKSGELSTDQLIDAQKKTVPQIELSNISALPDTTETGGETGDSVPPPQASAHDDDLLHWWRSAHLEAVRPPYQPSTQDDLQPPSSIVQELTDSDTIALASQRYPIIQGKKQNPEAKDSDAIFTPVIAGSRPAETVLPPPLDPPVGSQSIEPVASPLPTNSGIKEDIAAISEPRRNSGDTSHNSKSLNTPMDGKEADKSPHTGEEDTLLRLRKKILFGSDSAVISDEYLSLLSETVDWLKSHAGRTVQIIGYADSKGEVEYNQELSLKRAKAVAAYLENNNIANNRIHIEGRGVYPATNNLSNDGANARQLQRFVEIVSSPTGD